MSPCVQAPVLPLRALPFVLGLWECKSLGTGSPPQGPVRRGPENNGGPRPPRTGGLGWAAFQSRSSLFPSFLRKGRWTVARDQDSEQGSVVLASQGQEARPGGPSAAGPCPWPHRPAAVP